MREARVRLFLRREKMFRQTAAWTRVLKLVRRVRELRQQGWSR